MTPTTKLRFVERKIQVPYELQENVTQTKTVRILQQWWATAQECAYPAVFGLTPDKELGEWRDVPIEEEQA